MAKNLEYVFDRLQEGVALPALVKADTESLRLQNTLQKALPAIANVGSDPLVGYSTKARDALQLAIEKGLAYGETKANLNKQKAISRLKKELKSNILEIEIVCLKNDSVFLSRGRKSNQNARTPKDLLDKY